MKFSNSAKRELSFIDLLSVLSFFIGLENLDANLDQNDKAEIQQDYSSKMDALLKEIHIHLELQDDKMNTILQYLEELKK